MLSLNLQFFAKDGPGGEKTEPATEKKLSDARKEGQVAKSREIGNGFALLGLFLLLKFWAGSLGERMLSIFPAYYDKMAETIRLYNGQIAEGTISSLLLQMLLNTLIMIFPVLIVGVAITLVTEIAQVKWKPTAKPLQPKFSKLNPVKGFQKIFSSQSLMELIKSIAKIGLITYIAYTTLKDQVGMIFRLYDMPLKQAIVLLGDVVSNLGLKISAFYLVISFVDFGYQKWKFSEDMKMTKQEVKDEYKNAEGDPQVKGKIRQKMREVSQRRMMQALPEADVVITNPTHYAVAVKYDAEKYDAPIVLAKGEDYLAQKIKEKARECHIEIVENKPLARMLYANVEVGELIPPELYQAVAEVLAMVYKMQGRV
ncbi:MAG: flagellar biosynthesis protein FlhB [Lachnospiraceae bacterium]|nr:flagellar biosynthesis protein FlhB [Lachnospiraceae bacterium]